MLLHATKKTHILPPFKKTNLVLDEIFSSATNLDRNKSRFIQLLSRFIVVENIKSNNRLVLYRTKGVYGLHACQRHKDKKEQCSAIPGNGMRTSGQLTGSEVQVYQLEMGARFFRKKKKNRVHDPQSRRDLTNFLLLLFFFLIFITFQTT